MIPSCWDSIYALKLIKAYGEGRIGLDDSSIRRWHEGEYGFFEEVDVENAREVIGYHLAGHRLKNREALERAAGIQARAKEAAGA